MKIFLSGAEMTSEPVLHAHLKQKLSFPDYYGENLDALWDCIRCVDVPLTVVWQDFAQSQEHLGQYAERVLQTFRDAEQDVPGFILEVE
ncbi:barstar family protein [Hymenobacter yonginensis]|uniref:Barstar family protein n=1 Tax=Hymenobacter yonginensis TaxID=748197 RepID=A0ABY7PUW6_9BACT|nr:barstar family protein [Hymenobacter yonginensis]WBO86696.1 barstar family protein [Hymenobacter yonginensis]